MKRRRLQRDAAVAWCEAEMEYETLGNAMRGQHTGGPCAVCLALNDLLRKAQTARQVYESLRPPFVDVEWTGP